MKQNRSSWLDTVNPIRGLSISAAKGIFDSARRYGSALLQKIYAEIEACDPTLMTCVDRRAAAIGGIGWQTVARASARDKALADEQRQAADAFLAGIENLGEAIEHLDLAYFRGFSHCQPVWETPTSVSSVRLLDGWNFLRDPHDGAWYFNPGATDDVALCERITPAARLMTLTHRRPIDWPGLIIYIRKSLGEQDWGRYVERYGLPNFVATMHQGATAEQRAEYLATARAVRDGQPAALPAGGTVTPIGGDSRGQDPFSAFIDHQDRLMVLMATGGTLTSLAEADTGALAGGAQMDVWRQIVRRDVAAIAAAVNRALVRPFLEAAFPGREVAAEFAIDPGEKPGKLETAQLAATLRTAGYTIDQQELEEAVGFTLTKEADPGGMMPALANKAAGGGAPALPGPERSNAAPSPGNAGDLGGALAEAMETALAEAMAGELGADALQSHREPLAKRAQGGGRATSRPEASEG